MTASPIPLVARRSAATVSLALLAGACARQPAVSADEHASHGEAATQTSAAATVQAAGLPAGAHDVRERLAASPRHAEWAIIHTGPDSVKAYVVYPERRDKAPVVVVIHEIFGLSSWIRGVADQLAADGFIAVAPDLLTGMAMPTSGDTLAADVARATIMRLAPEDAQRKLEAVGRYGMSLPAAQPRYGVVGFCWGGAASFNHAVRSPAGLRAAVVYYGTSPSNETLASVRVPVLGLYGANDARVNSTVPRADSVLRALGRPFTYRMFDRAGHGFLRAQQTADTNATGNMAATREAWPMTVSFFRQHLGA